MPCIHLNPALAFLCLAPCLVRAQFAVTNDVVSAGLLPVNGDAVTLHGTVGQLQTMVFSSPEFVLYGGFWSVTKKATGPGTGTGNATDDPVIAARTRLHQNYPNPFNPTTHIAFELAQTANVTLTVHDVYGRTVRRLLDRRMPAGLHTLILQADDLATGVYFYSIRADEFSDTRTMILLK